MMEVAASYYDGKTSQRKEVRVRFDPSGQLWIVGLEQDVTYTLSEVRITPRVGNTPRCIYLPDGAKCETLDNDTIDAILRLEGTSRWQEIQHGLESRLGYVILLLALTILALWGFVEYGMPALAKRAAYALPATAESTLGREALQALDRTLFSPSDLPEERQNQVARLFDDMTKDLAGPRELRSRLEFRESVPFGANAFALPASIVVVTDSLVVLAEHDNELRAVLAHELGHVMGRHALRSLLQNSAVALLIASVTGDVTSITALASSVPTMLMQAKHSRAFEAEADRFALQYLRDHNIPPKYFADFLLRLEKESGQGSESRGYLATHPPTRERVKLMAGER